MPHVLLEKEGEIVERITVDGELPLPVFRAAFAKGLEAFGFAECEECGAYSKAPLIEVQKHGLTLPYFVCSQCI